MKPQIPWVVPFLSASSSIWSEFWSRGISLCMFIWDENGLYTTAVALKRHLCLSDRHPNAADIVN